MEILNNLDSNSKVVMMVDPSDLKEAITQAVNEAMKSQGPEPEVYITLCL